MGKIIDLVGKRFGRLIVLKQSEKVVTARKRITWLCRCDCGNTCIVTGYNLVHKQTQSCGCLKREVSRSRGIASLTTATVICSECKKPFESTYLRNANKTCSPVCAQKRHSAQQYKRSKQDFRHVMAVILRGARSRAIKRKQVFNLTIGYLMDLLKKQNHRCARTDVPFEISMGYNQRHPWAISIDQILPQGGYTKNNIQLVCMAYNFAKHTWTDDVVMTLAQALIKTGRKNEKISKIIC